MLKQNIFVILSGMIAAAAVFGWMDDTDPAVARMEAIGDNRPVRIDSPNAAVNEAVQALNASSNMALKALADAAVQSNLAEMLSLVPPQLAPETETTQESKVGTTRGSSRSKDKREPKEIEAPSINPTTVYRQALETIRVSDVLKEALDLAIVNIADGELLVSTNDTQTQAFLNHPGRKSTLTGTYYNVHDDVLETWSWYCITTSRKLCLAASFIEAPRVNTTDGCISASRATGIVCGKEALVGSRIFNGENSRIFNGEKCNLSQYPDATADFEKILGYQTQSGIADGLIFSKVGISPECTVVSAIPETSVNILSEETLIAKQSDYHLLRLILSFCAALVTIILGLLCTRRRKDEDENHLKSEIRRWEMRESTLHSKINQLNDEIKTLESERDRLKDKTYDLQKDKDDSEKACSRLLSENAQIKEQLDFAKQSYRESSLTIQSLEVETASLRDKLAASDQNSTATGKTLVTTYPRDNQAAANTEILRSLKEDEFDDSDMNGQTDPPQMMPSSPTRPVSESGLSVPGNGSSKTDHNLKSLLSFGQNSVNNASPISDKDPMDETWDEIADSFDSIIALPNKQKRKILDFSTTTIPSAPAPNLLANSNPSLTPNEAQDSGSTATHLLGALRQQAAESSYLPISDRRPANTATSEPLSTSIHSQSRVEAASRPNGTSISGIADSPASKSTEGVAESFKPSPSWSGRKIADRVPEVGSVSQELVNALQRRARDVSQLNSSVSRNDADSHATTPNRSGALEFNRAMSRSGMFSLTGSRSKISLKTEADKTYFNDLYDKYVENMRQNGEDPTKYTREQFISRMAKEKETLMSKFQCSDVTFSIYTKDGKTSLKAIPKK